MLSQAHDLRKQAGDWHALEITERNLQVLCWALRAKLHGDQPRKSLLERLARRPVLAYTIAALLVVLGGVAGATTRSSHNATGTLSNSSGSVKGTKTPTTTTGTTKTKTSTGKTTSTQTTTGKTNTDKTPGVKTSVLTVNSQPAITSAEAATFTYKQPGSFTVTATGIPTPTITEAGTLPPGVSFNVGVLSGTPEKVGVYPIAFTATNGVGSDAVQSDFTLTVER
ncbi:MAG: Ig domain-containing protein [Solirubrobacteraceae bacterium]